MYQHTLSSHSLETETLGVWIVTTLVLLAYPSVWNPEELGTGTVQLWVANLSLTAQCCRTKQQKRTAGPAEWKN
jgi:hypothetical protein